MGRTSVVIWLLLISVAASDKLPDLSDLIGGYLPPSNSFGSSPPKDPLQGFSFDLPVPAPSPSASHSAPEKVPNVSKESQSEPQLGTCILANPYVQQASHEPPKQTYVAPDKSEEQTVNQEYISPQQSYIPPDQSKEETKQVYEPPKQTYGPPDTSEEIKIEQTYEAPLQTYLAPHESEESKVEEIQEPSTGYLLPDKSEENEKPIEPESLYEPPVKSPTSHFQSPQNTYKPPKSQPPKKTFQVPELIQTYGPPNHNRPKPESESPKKEDDDSREGSASFSSHFSPSKPSKPSTTYGTPSSSEKEDKQSSSSLFFKVPEPTYSQPEDSDETKEPSHKESTQRPELTYGIPRPSYQVPQPTYQAPQTSYFIPTPNEDDSEETPEQSVQQTFKQPEPSYRPPSQSHKSPSGTNFFSVPQQTYKVPESSSASLESSNESREHSQPDESEDTKPSQQYEVPQIDSQETYKPPSSFNEKPNLSYEPPIQSYKPPQVTEFSSRPVASKSKTNFFSIPKLGNKSPSAPSSSEVKQTYSPPKTSFKQKESTIKFRPLLKKPKPSITSEDSDEKFSVPKLSSIPKPSVEHKTTKPSETHNFFKTPSNTQKHSTGSKSEAPIPSKDSHENDRDKKKPRPSGSIRFPGHQTLDKPKDEDSKEEEKQPSKQTHRVPDQSYKVPNNDDTSQDKHQPPKQEATNIESTFAKSKDSSPQSAETTTMKMMMPYDFKWGVKDDESGNDFGQTAVSDGMVEKGSYHVLLPDGRKQIVTYLADWETGFHVDVKYEGEVNPFPQSTQNKESSVSYS